MMRIDVLNLEWTSAQSRDRLMATLVCNYLRLMGYSVIERSIFDGYQLIYQTKPKVLFLSNFIGASNNHDILLYANALGINAVDLTSEGSMWAFTKERIAQFLWGWNHDKILFQNIRMLWSERTKKAVLDIFPELLKKIKVSGGVGFDNYKIRTMLKQEDFLLEFGKIGYKYVIGCGCPDFGFTYKEDHRYSTWLRYYGNIQFERFRADRKKFNTILLGIISNNPDKLFILKEHPGTLLGRFASGIEGLEKFPNVIIHKNEKSILDYISVSDFWIVYDSTTSMEAWLLGKQTCLLNPSGIDFPRDDIHKGSPNFENQQSLQSAIDSYYNKGIIPGFDELFLERKKIIKDIIQWDDGLNHVRAGNEIISLLESPRKVIIRNENLRMKFQRMKQHLIWVLSPYFKSFSKFKNHYKYRERFNNNALIAFQKKLLAEQLSYYDKMGLAQKDLLKIRCT